MKWVTLWSVDLDATGVDSDRWLDWVDEAERRQADRFVNPRDGRRFLARRAARRAVLAAELKLPIQAVRFVAGIHGKPALAGPANVLQFNTTHSAGRALIATSLAGPLGLDLERHLPLGEDLHRVSSAFNPSEQKSLAALPAELQTSAFFALWTRKEALLKAVGLGLSRALDSFVVPVDPGAVPQWFFLDPEASPWWLQSLSVGPGLSAALASTNRVRLDQRDFSFS